MDLGIINGRGQSQLFHKIDNYDVYFNIINNTFPNAHIKILLEDFCDQNWTELIDILHERKFAFYGKLIDFDFRLIHFKGKEYIICYIWPRKTIKEYFRITESPSLLYFIDEETYPVQYQMQMNKNLMK